MEGIRIIEIPKVKMVTSGNGSVDELMASKFKAWISKRNDFTPQDFMWFDRENNDMVWYYALTDENADTEGLEVIDFEGGLYAASVSIDEDDNDGERVYNEIKDWITNGKLFDLDERSGHYCMCHVITPKAVKQAMGYNQLDIFVPIKIKK